MNRLRTTFLVSFLVVFGPILQAAPLAGYVIEWGWNTPAGKAAPAKQVLGDAIAIAAGRGYSMALKRDGTIVTWGRMVNDLYPATVPAGLGNVVAIAAGDNFCLAITTNNAVAEKFRR